MRKHKKQKKKNKKKEKKENKKVKIDRKSVFYVKISNGITE